ncbi:MAG: hypothetical protein R2748_04100 [Bryobacterales bacterium]
MAAGTGHRLFDDGKPVRMLGVNLDITDRKEIEAALAKHQEELEELVAAKTSDLRSANTALEASRTELEEFDGATHPSTGGGLSQAGA